MDNTVVQTEYEVLLDLVENLKSKLKEERTKNLNLEKNIREELCNEFNQMMVDVEQGYEKRIQVRKRPIVHLGSNGDNKSLSIVNHTCIGILCLSKLELSVRLEKN